MWCAGARFGGIQLHVQLILFHSPPCILIGYNYILWLGIKAFYYMDTDEIPGFLLLLKNHIFTARSEHIIFIFHM